MVAWSSAFDSGAHPVVEHYYSGHTVGVRLRVMIMIKVRVMGYGESVKRWVRS